MIKLKCDSCGNTSFYEESSRYICEYCNSSIAKKPNNVIHNNTYVFNYSKYKYALIIAVAFIVYMLIDNFTDYNRSAIAQNSNIPVKKDNSNKYSSIKHRISEKFSTSTTSKTFREYINISLYKQGSISFCYRDNGKDYVEIKDVYGDWSKKEITTCISNQQTRLVQEDGYVEATEVLVGSQMDIKLTKYDNYDKKMWERTLGTLHDDKLTHMVEGVNGYVMLAGTTKGNSKFAMWAIQVIGDLEMANLTSLTEPKKYWKEL